MNQNMKNWQTSRWSLQDLFPSGNSHEMAAAFADLEKSVSGFEGYRSELNEEIPFDKFLQIIRELEEITKLMFRIGGYAELWFTEDTQNQAAQTLLAKMEQFSAEISNRLMFFTLWWKGLGNEAAKRLMENSGDYAYWLEEMRHFKDHTLSEAEEKIINLKDVSGNNAIVMLYDSYTNRYTFKITVDGEEKEVTRGELMSYVRMPDADLRAKAYQELYHVYGNDGPILGQMYQALVRDWYNEQVTLRKFKAPISARNLSNDIPDDVVDMLLDVCQKNSSTFQRFFKLKALLLKMERLRRYDIYAPISTSSKEYSISKAAEMILDSFNSFDPSFATLALKVIDENHLDSQVRKGKRSGAFCATVNPQLTPWVLLNYQGRSEDVATTAHELGHAIHSMLASHHSVFTHGACLPLAETASTFGEMLLVERLLEEENDEDVRRDLLFGQVDDAYATILRQAYFASFEIQAHEMIRQGTSVDDLSEAYFANLKEQFGDSVIMGEEFRWEWVSIPHIYHTPFYVYAYTFGQLLVLSLFKQFKEEGDSFKPRYIKLLSTGGSEAPMKMLAEAGFDIQQPSFWQGGFDVVNGLVTQLERMPI